MEFASKLGDTTRKFLLKLSDARRVRRFGIVMRVKVRQGKLSVSKKCLILI